MLKTNVYIKKYRKKKGKYAFSLSEILIVIVIFGIISAIIIPSLVKRHLENINRTRLKKSMTTYESILSKIVIENGIKDDVALKNKFNNDNCAAIRVYFKSVQDGDDNCIYKSSDGVWWNLSDITHPIISVRTKINSSELKNIKELAKNKYNKEIFGFVGRFDYSNSLRINDVVFESDTENTKIVEKLYDFVNNKQAVFTAFDKCKAQNASTCVVNGYEYTKVSMETTVVTKDQNGDNLCVWNFDTNAKECGSYESKVEAGDYYILNLGRPTDYTEIALDYTGSTCQYCIDKGLGDYYNAAKKYCESAGGRIATLAEVEASGLANNGYFWGLEENSVNSAARDFKNAIGYNVKTNGNASILCIEK